MMWAKFDVGRIIACPAMVLSVLGVKCSKISKSQMSMEERYEGSRDGTVVLLDGSIPYPMLQTVELENVSYENQDKGDKNTVFEKLNNEYQEIVC